MIRETLTLLGAVTVIGIVTTVAVIVVRDKRRPKGGPNDWVYHVAQYGVFEDGRPMFVAAVAPDSGDNWVWRKLTTTFDSLEAAKKAALAEIAKAGGIAKEFVS